MEQNYYELLEIPLESTESDVERAYRIARATYTPTSTATYSMFTEEENAAILRRIEEAYAVLSDAKLRRDYDARLRREEAPSHVRVSIRSAPVPPPKAKPRPTWTVPPSPALDPDDSLEPEDGIYDGTVLRRIRMALGIELEEISAITKVNEFYLDCIETNRYSELPSTVYVRGFLCAYARCVGLEAEQVAVSYMERFLSSREYPRGQNGR